ncbi:MAG: VWA domain-containing protein [Phycisphaerales bacterium]
MASEALTLASVAIGPIGFERPAWLVLAPVLGVLVLVIARKSLAGLGTPTRVTALAVRLLVITLIAAALARPSWRTRGEDVSVVAVIDASRSIPAARQADIDRYIQDSAEADRRPNDRLGTVTVAREGFVQALPSKLNKTVERQFIGQTDGTNLADGVNLALATAPEDSATRLVLISDGNETSGSVLRAAEAARAVGVPIDVLPVDYQYDDEVLVDNLITPAVVREGETISVRVVLTATRPAEGRLLLSEGGEPIDLDPGTEGLGVPVELKPGKNVFTVQVTPRSNRPQDFEAVFEPTRSLASGDQTTGDSITENNRARSITFVGSEGRVLLVAETAEESAALERAMAESEIKVSVVASSNFPTGLPELNGFECVILANEPAYNFTENQQELMRQYVHDTGGGLVMVGGPESFGAGGWIGSPLADALPIKLDPPQKRQMPRGALVLVMHSIEAPQGVYLAKEVCNAAVDNLSRLDLVGIVEFSGLGVDWVHQLQPVGDRSGVKQAINRLQFGDMPSFDQSLNLALQGLKAAAAGQKHCIVISDGDPSLSRTVLRNFRQAGITISAVGINPHSPRDLNTMRLMATETNGEYYDVGSNPAIGDVVSIFIKEAQTIRRSLIWEGDPFSPAVVNVSAEPMRGIGAVPPIGGYVVAAEREGLSLVTLRGLEDDPIGAIWQYGLGKVVTFTSDATTRWAPGWVSWAGYKQFWEQHVRWAMRPGGSATMRVTTENRGDRTLVQIEALDPEGERLDFAHFDARVALPDGTGAPLEVRQVGPGRYEGVFESADPGSYVVNLNYRAPGSEAGTVLEGSVQAAVSRPFADEFRTLASNSALLRQVAAMTGGRVLTGDPAQDDLWTHEGVSMPVASRPIWIALALVAIGAFLADVGVRRVRIDPRAIFASVRRGFRAGATRDDAERLESLRAVRARAQARLSTDEGGRQRERKFEAPADVPASAGPVALSGDAEQREPPLVKPKTEPKGEEPEDSLSALRRAKRRARDEMQE